MDGRNSSGSGLGVLGLLGVAFVVLKLCGVIDWSWWWVTAPFWGPLVLVFGSMLVCFLALFFLFVGVFIYGKLMGKL
jgi:hypothetical protein